MKKTSRVVVAFVFLIALLASLIRPATAHDVCSAQSEKIVGLLGAGYATEEGLIHHGITLDEVSEFTPILDSAISRLQGNSYAPALKGTSGNRHIDATINLAQEVAAFDASSVNLSETALEFWLNIDLKQNLITRGLTIVLSDEEDVNKITWTITTDEIRQLLTRTEISSFDAKIFGSVVSNTPIGWAKFTLPVYTGLVAGELIEAGKFTFTKMKITQTAETGSDQPLLFYDMALISTSNALTENACVISDYSAIVLNPSAQIVADDYELYLGELFPQFMSKRDLFLCCWIGDVNYLDGEHDSNLKVLTDSGIGSYSKEYYSYGSRIFALKSRQYTIAYGLEYDGRFVGLLSKVINVADYGKGVWLDSDIEELEIGETKRIYFNVHNAFSNANIQFASTNEAVLKINEVNTIHKYIEVEALKKGDAGITISVTDDRLQGTEYEDTGLINYEFEIKVVKPEKNANTTKVMLWIAFGGICAGLIYLAVKAILDTRKMQIK